MAEIKIYANLAQLIEQLISNQQVVGLNPTVSSNNVSVLTEQIDTNIIQKWMVFFVVRKFIQERMAIGYKYN